MGVYLQKLKSTLNEVQARQINNLLSKKREKGEVRNLEEYRNNLQKLTDKLLSEKIAPTLELFLADLDEVIDHDTYNFMIDRVKDDLSAIFSQESSLSEVLDDHNGLINKIILESIKLGIANLEAKVSLYEFLANNEDGFDEAQFNTFKTSEQLRTVRSTPNSATLFLDPRTKRRINTDVSFDLNNDRILSGLIDENTLIDISGIRQIFDNEASQTIDNVNFASNNINLAIDGEEGTYWIYSILAPKVIKPCIKAKIELTLEQSSDVNFVDIEPASLRPMKLERIEYIDNNGVLKNISIDSVIDRKKRIQFQSINTNRLILVLTQCNSIEIQYEEKQTNDNFVKALLDEDTDVDITSIEAEVIELIRSSRLLDLIFNVDPNAEGPQKKFHEYVIGLDNIFVGFAKYASDSIFVSNKLEIFDLTQVGLKAEEQRPLQSGDVVSLTKDVYPSDDSAGTFLGSIEFWASIQSFNSAEQLVRLNNVPLLPIKAKRVSQERLLLTERSNSVLNNAGFLMFFPVLNPHDIIVYRDGTKLQENSDWAIDKDTSNTDAPPNGTRNSVAIRIFKPIPTSFYTVSYTPSFSNTRSNPANLLDQSILRVVDLAGDGSIKHGKNNIIYIDADQRAKNKIAFTRVYLLVILRRNTPDIKVTPVVDEYLLLSSSIKQGKFDLL